MNLKSCVDCRRPVPPHHTTLAQYPGTMSGGPGGRCLTCAKNGKPRPDKVSAVDVVGALEGWLAARRRRIAEAEARVARLQAVGVAA